jgi:hypothetical protein
LCFNPTNYNDETDAQTACSENEGHGQPATAAVVERTFAVTFPANPNRKHTRGKRGAVRQIFKQDWAAVKQQGKRRSMARESKAYERNRRFRGSKSKKVKQGKAFKYTENPVRSFRRIEGDEVTLHRARSVRVQSGTEFPKKEARLAKAAWKLAFGEETRKLQEQNKELKSFLGRFKRNGSLEPMPCCIRCVSKANETFKVLSQRQFRKLLALLLQKGCVEVHPGPAPKKGAKVRSVPEGHGTKIIKIHKQNVSLKGKERDDTANLAPVENAVEPKKERVQVVTLADPSDVTAEEFEAVRALEVATEEEKIEQGAPRPCTSSTSASTVAPQPVSPAEPISIAGVATQGCSNARAVEDTKGMLDAKCAEPKLTKRELHAHKPKRNLRFKVIPINQTPPPVPKGSDAEKKEDEEGEELPPRVLDGHNCTQTEIRAACSEQFYADPQTVVEEKLTLTTPQDERLLAFRSINVVKQPVRVIQVTFFAPNQWCQNIPILAPVLCSLLQFVRCNGQSMSLLSLMGRIQRISFMLWTTSLIFGYWVLGPMMSCVVAASVVYWWKWAVELLGGSDYFWGKKVGVYVPHMLSMMINESNPGSNQHTHYQQWLRTAGINIPDKVTTEWCTFTCLIAQTVSRMHKGFREVGSGVLSVGSSKVDLNASFGLSSEYYDFSLVPAPTPPDAGLPNFKDAFNALYESTAPVIQRSLHTAIETTKLALPTLHRPRAEMQSRAPVFLSQGQETSEDCLSDSSEDMPQSPRIETAVETLAMDFGDALEAIRNIDALDQPCPNYPNGAENCVSVTCPHAARRSLRSRTSLMAFDLMKSVNSSIEMLTHVASITDLPETLLTELKGFQNLSNTLYSNIQDGSIVEWTSLKAGVGQSLSQLKDLCTKFQHLSSTFPLEIDQQRLLGSTITGVGRSMARIGLLWKSISNETSCKQLKNLSIAICSEVTCHRMTLDSFWTFCKELIGLAHVPASEPTLERRG